MSREISYLLKINPVSILVKLGPLVTYEVFMKWKEDRRIKKEAKWIQRGFYPGA